MDNIGLKGYVPHEVMFRVWRKNYCPIDPIN